MKALALGIVSLCLATVPASADGVTILGVSIAKLSKANLCGSLGGGGQPPAITIKHTKGGGMIAVSMADHLSDGRTNDHGSTSVSADASGTTRVAYAFKPPCNLKTGEGLKSAYYVTATSDGSSKTVLWSRYP
jgi:hypothetical protein